MLKWAQLLINKGEINGHEIIKKTSLENILKPRQEVTDEYTVCLSWFETIEDR